MILKWYYSECLKLYVSLEPLKINNRVFQVAKKHGIQLDWDDYGNVIMLDFAEFKILVEELGGVILSPAEFWQLYDEACKKDCEPLKNSLMSPYFTEVLDRVYVEDNIYIDHCRIKGTYEYEGEQVQYESVVGRPGWISFEDIDLQTGHPIKVHEKEANILQMKYWSPDLPNTMVKKTIALRGYVTSVAMPSLDLGIPADTRQPKMMVRFCTPNKPVEMKEAEIQRKGFPLTFEGFVQYIGSNKVVLEDALIQQKMITFVCGHKNPDADTVVSSVFEAYRRHIQNSDPDMIYLPLIQSEEMPKEIAYILGETVTNGLIYAEKTDISVWVSSGRLRFIFTDQNYQKEYQKYVIAIIDHHKKSRELEKGTLDIPCEIQMQGSCTALIAKKYMEQGYDFDRKLSKILYSAMLMDTENRVAHKMTPEDVSIMDLFCQKAQIASDRELYETIMNYLISETDGEKLYGRDYKHYYGFGFAVLKVTGMMDKPEFESWIDKVLGLAEEDNKKYNDYFTLIKVVDYQVGGQLVEKERIYWVWNHQENLYLIQKIKELIRALIGCCIPQGTIKETEQYIEVSGGGKQLSRKQIVPSIEAMVECCCQYTYSKALDKWVARDFLRANAAIFRCFPNVYTDEWGRVCKLSFWEAKELVKQLGMELLSLKEYWQVYAEACENRDIALQKSLTNSEFLEFLDSCAVEGKLVHKPDVTGENLEFGNKGEKAEILYANPGLISPKCIDKETGLPNHIFPAANYYDKSLWRYWSPMPHKIYVFLRSYIFLLQQPCLDAKSEPGESFLNLGIRPVRKRNLDMEVRITVDKNSLVICYKSEYDEQWREIYRMGEKE